VTVQYKKEIRSHFHLKKDNIKSYSIVINFEVVRIPDVVARGGVVVNPLAPEFSFKF
jgi:hypothetical protein